MMRKLRFSRPLRSLRPLVGFGVLALAGTLETAAVRLPAVAGASVAALPASGTPAPVPGGLALPSEISARGERLRAKLSLSASRKLDAAAKPLLRAAGDLSAAGAVPLPPQQLVAAADRAGRVQFPGRDAQDRQAIDFLVMLHAARVMDMELNAVMAENDALRVRRDQARDVASRIAAEKARRPHAAPPLQPTSPPATPSQPARPAASPSQTASPAAPPSRAIALPPLRHNMTAATTETLHLAYVLAPPSIPDPPSESLAAMPLPQLDKLAAETKDQLNALSEVSDAQSLRLQLLMDRRSKLIAALSNLERQIGATAEDIVQNLK